MLSGVLSTSFTDRPIPEITDDEVLIEVKKTGICGSDLHFYVEGKLGEKLVTEPIVLGHESSGVIVKVGPKVDSSRVGERVAIEPWTHCRICDLCKSGSYQLCLACYSPRRGTLSRYYKVTSDLAYKLPDNLSFEDGAMMEPLAVAVHAISSIAKMRAGQSVVVFGCGPIGLLCMAVTRALGASRILAIDNNPSRIEFAKKYAATDTFTVPEFLPNESKMDYSKRSSKLLKEMLGMLEKGGNEGFDLVLEATGAETCIQMGILVAKPGGTFVQVGIGITEVTVPITLLLTKELTMKGTSRYGPGDYPLAIALASSGKVDLKPLATHRFEFDDAVAALETTRAGIDAQGNRVLKTLISGVTA